MLSCAIIGTYTSDGDYECCQPNGAALMVAFVDKPFVGLILYSSLISGLLELNATK